MSGQQCVEGRTLPQRLEPRLAPAHHRPIRSVPCQHCSTWFCRPLGSFTGSEDTTKIQQGDTINSARLEWRSGSPLRFRRSNWTPSAAAGLHLALARSSNRSFDLSPLPCHGTAMLKALCHPKTNLDYTPAVSHHQPLGGAAVHRCDSSNQTRRL